MEQLITIMPKELKQFLTSVESLLSFCGLSPEDAGYSDTPFPVRVPVAFAARIRKNDRSDPLLLQVLPRSMENEPSPASFTADPVNDRSALVTPGLLHKYHGRALLLCTATCAINCRYCFRREGCCESLPGDGSADGAMLAYLRHNSSIRELILSGGDPLMVSTRRLQQLFNAFSTIDHLTTIRIHTRVPVVHSSGITPGKLHLLSAAAKRFSIITVIHANHPREISTEVRSVLSALRNTGTMLLNQSVLLKGINDSVDTLAALSRTLVSAGVQPYYLHQLDRVRGAHQFEVDEAYGKNLIEQLHKQLSGYAVPSFVREIPGAPGKQPIT